MLQQAVPADVARHPVRILDNQYLRLLLNAPREAVSICMAIRFRAAFDPAAAQATWRALLDRHPGLRLCLGMPPLATSLGAGVAVILEGVEPPAMTIQDLRPMPRHAREARVQREFEALTHIEWHYDRWPLHHFSLLCVDDDRLELFFASDHAISDGLSEVLVLSEFIEIYLAQLSGRDARLPAAIAPQDYARIAAQMGRYRPSATELALAKTEMERPAEVSRACLWNPNRSTTAASTRKFEVRCEELDEQATARLLRLTVDRQCSMNSVLLAGFLKSLSLHPHPPRVAMLLSTSGTNYPDLEVDRVFGGFSQVVPIDFEVPAPNTCIEEVLTAVHTQAQERLGSGLDRTLARVFADNVKMIPLNGSEVPQRVLDEAADNKRANLYFSYIGHARFDPAADDTEISCVRSGGTNPAGSLECQFIITRGCLKLFFVFDSLYFDARLIERFIHRFARELDEFASTVPSEVPDEAPPPASDCGKLANQVLDIASGTLHRYIAADQLALDLEGELGVDSLQRVRLAIQLYSRSGKAVHRDELLACRTLAHMVAVIAEHCPDGFADS